MAGWARGGAYQLQFECLYLASPPHCFTSTAHPCGQHHPPSHRVNRRSVNALVVNGRLVFLDADTCGLVQGCTRMPMSWTRSERHRQPRDCVRICFTQHTKGAQSRTAEMQPAWKGLRGQLGAAGAGHGHLAECQEFREINEGDNISASGCSHQ